MTQQRSRTLNRLSAREVDAATEPGYYPDGGGLFLRVSSNGGKRWLFRFTLPKQPRREMGLGSGERGHVSLKQARVLAQEARELVQRGLDPIVTRTAKADADRANQQMERAAVTFGSYMDQFLDARLSRYRNEKHRYQWRQSLETYAAALRDKRLKDIGRDDILAVLEPIWDAKHETAARLRSRLENIFDHAIQNRKYFGDNPARWELFNETLSPRRKLSGRGHMPAMPGSQLPAFVATLREKGGITALALEFLILGANRSGEVRLATWDEIDSEQRLWVIPGERMKVKERKGAPNNHAVILTPRMTQILEAMLLHRRPVDRRRSADGQNVDFIFPGRKDGQPLSDMTLRMLMRRLHAKVAPASADPTVHGFRSTFRDWVGNETHFARELAEEALSHTLPDVERSYRRGQALAKRRVMMAAWEAFCEGREHVANVVELRA